MWDWVLQEIFKDLALYNLAGENTRGLTWAGSATSLSPKHQSHLYCTTSICTNYTSVFVPTAQIYLHPVSSYIPPNHFYPLLHSKSMGEGSSKLDICRSWKKGEEKASTTNSLLDLLVASSPSLCMPRRLPPAMSWESVLIICSLGISQPSRLGNRKCKSNENGPGPSPIYNLNNKTNDAKNYRKISFGKCCWSCSTEKTWC